jgi:hypothetical protein
MQKRFFIWALILLCGPVFADRQNCGRLSEKTLKQVCDRIPTWEGTFECMGAGKGGYLDGCALAACDRCVSSNGTVECVRSIRDQRYTLAEVLYCDSMNTDNLTAKCFHSSGTSYARYQQLELAKKSGRSDGKRTAKDFSTNNTVAISAGQVLGREFAVNKAQSDSRQRNFNEGYRQARLFASSRTASFYSEGQVLGATLAQEQAMKVDGVRAFTSAVDARLNATPAASQALDLAGDTTPISNVGSDLDLHHQRQVPAGSQPPQFAMPTDAVAHSPIYSQDMEKNISVAFPDTGENPQDSPCLDSDRDCSQAYSEGYRDGFRFEYRQLYLADFAKGFNEAAEAEYAALVLKPNPSAHEQGVQSGSRDQGILDSFASQYPREKELAEIEANRRFSASLSRSFLAIVRNLRIETQGRAMLIPGQRFSVDVEIDNLGGADVPAGYFQLSTDHFQPGTLDKNSRTLPSIPANTRMIFKSVFSGLAHRASAGTEYKMTLALSTLDDKNQLRVRQNLPATVVARFPLELVSLEPKTAFNGTASVPVAITVRNNLEMPSEAFTATLNTEPAAVRVETKNALLIPALNPSETWSAEVQLQPSIWTNDGVPTVFTFTLADSKQKPVSLQPFYHLIDLNRPVALRALSGAENVSNSVVNGRAGGSVPVQISVNCRQAVAHSDGYRFRYAGSNFSGITFIGTVGADVGKCEAGRMRVLSSGSVRIDRSAKGQLGTLQFHLEKNGAVVQGLQLFVKAQ